MPHISPRALESTEEALQSRTNSSCLFVSLLVGWLQETKIRFAKATTSDMQEIEITHVLYFITQYKSRRVTSFNTFYCNQLLS